MKYLSILLLVLITGCTSQSYSESAADKLLEAITGKEYSRNASQCLRIKNSCQQGSYEEWTLENGKKACACN